MDSTCHIVLGCISGTYYQIGCAGHFECPHIGLRVRAMQCGVEGGRRMALQGLPKGNTSVHPEPLLLPHLRLRPPNPIHAAPYRLMTVTRPINDHR